MLGRGRIYTSSVPGTCLLREYSGGGAQVDGKNENLDLSGAGGGGSFASNNNWSLLSGHCPVGNGFVITFLS